MKLVYIACPYTTEDRERFEIYQNTARYHGILVAELGLVPVMPTVNTGKGFSSVRNYEWWLEATQALMLRCDAVLCVPGSIDILKSVGCFHEREAAYANRIGWHDSVESLAHWAAINVIEPPTNNTTP